MSGVVWRVVKPTYHSCVEWLIADVTDVSTLHQLSVFHAWVIVRLTLRYTTPGIHCRDRRYECDGEITGLIAPWIVWCMVVWPGLPCWWEIFHWTTDNWLQVYQFPINKRSWVLFSVSLAAVFDVFTLDRVLVTTCLKSIASVQMVAWKQSELESIVYLQWARYLYRWTSRCSRTRAIPRLSTHPR